MAIVAEAAFRLFHGLTDSMEIVAGRNYRKEQNQRTTQSADDDKRGARPWLGRNPSPPQQVCRQQQGKPAKIKKEFH